MTVDASHPSTGPVRSSAHESHAASAGTPHPALAGAKDWRRTLTRNVWLTDLLVLTVVVFGTQILWFGFDDRGVVTRSEDISNAVPYWVFSAGLIIMWMWALAFADTRTMRMVGAGNTEYLQVAAASFRLFGILAIIAFLLRVDVARGYLLIALPAGVLLLEASRWGWRQFLVRRRAAGTYTARALLVGSRSSVTQIARELDRHPSAGYRVVAACVPASNGTKPPELGVPVIRDVDAISTALEQFDADTVIVTGTDDLPPDRVKRISWSLVAGRQHLVLAPSIIDIAGPRIHTRPVAGLPLIHVEVPHLSRGQLFVKRSLDLVSSLLALVILSPLLLLLALLVAVSSPGRVLYAQERVGLRGRRFRMYKFRTMVDGADALAATLRDRQDAGNDVLFKMHDDPRVTRIGRFLRRHSLDELPQLLNVIGGSMSLVGPRPPLAREVDLYDAHVHRRFLVKPGITGLWQVSGRSTLSWEDSVRLDLSYVENWSLVGDLVILGKTTRAVVRPGDTAA